MTTNDEDRERKVLRMWPRFEDGEPVMLGDVIEATSGELKGELFEVKRFTFGDGKVTMRDKAGGHYCNVKFGKRVKRPENLAADGKPLLVGERVWGKDGKEYEVLDIDPERFAGNAYVLCGYLDKWESTLFAPNELTHEQPDSWEKWREDAKKFHCSYFGRTGKHCNSDGGCPAMKFHGRCEDCRTLDLERRAKALCGKEAEHGDR